MFQTLTTSPPDSHGEMLTVRCSSKGHSSDAESDSRPSLVAHVFPIEYIVHFSNKGVLNVEKSSWDYFLLLETTMSCSSFHHCFKTLNTHLNFLPLGVQTILKFLQLSFKKFNPLPITQTLDLSHLKPSFSNFFFSPYESVRT